jgi:NitT/TauT family transport system ATP-binding protein
VVGRGRQRAQGLAIGEALIRIERVSKRFETRSGPVEAVRDVDLEVADGELVTVVGRSGCGKSTLLRVLAGLLPVTSGSVAIAGQPVDGPRRDVALMFQRSALLPWRSVLDNVLLPIDVANGDRTAARRDALELLELTGLTGFERARPYELSGGMQQRAALCRALISKPRVLLMDEPFAALDALTREELSLELQRLWQERRKTIVFVTHSIDEAVVLSDRVVVMTPRPGRIARVVPVGLTRPRSVGMDGYATVAEAVREPLFHREAA